MADVKNMSDTGLLNALIDETLKYTSLISTRRINSDEYRQCKETLQSIQEELDARHPQSEESGRDANKLV